MKNYYILLALLLAMISANAASLPGESIVLDPNTGNYTITYLGVNEETGKRDVLRTATYEPATKIEPNVYSSLKVNNAGLVSYSYRVKNGIASRQPIVKLQLDSVSNLATTDLLSQTGPSVQSNTTAQNWGVASYPMVTPQGWTARVLASPVGRFRVSFSSIKNSLPAGHELDRIRFYSQDLAGIGLAHIQGDSEITIWSDEGPIGEIGSQLKQIQNSDYISRPAIVPSIAIPFPFDASILLERIRIEVQTWPIKQLLDATYVAQLDRYLVAAVTAYRNNQTKVAQEQIEALRKLLAKEHHYLDNDDEDNDDIAEHKAATTQSIDRLAARVLDFDLRYVLQRMEKEHEHHHDEGDRRKEH